MIFGVVVVDDVVDVYEWVCVVLLVVVEGVGDLEEEGLDVMSEDVGVCVVVVVFLYGWGYWVELVGFDGEGEGEGEVVLVGVLVVSGSWGVKWYNIFNINYIFKFLLLFIKVDIYLFGVDEDSGWVDVGLCWFFGYVFEGVYVDEF